MATSTPIRHCHDHPSYKFFHSKIVFPYCCELPISLLNVCFIVNVAPTPLQCTWVLEIKRVAKCNPFLGS